MRRLLGLFFMIEQVYFFPSRAKEYIIMKSDNMTCRKDLFHGFSLTC
jgi:hypothetical protein